MEITTLSRSVVRNGLRQLRRSVDMAEAVAERVGVKVDDDWLPVRAFERFEGDSKRVVGALLRDEELAEEGRRQRARSDELGRAARLHTEAATKRAGADARFERQQQNAVKQRRAVGQAAAELERQRAAEHAVGRERARRIARRREDAVDEADVVRRATVDAAVVAAAETRAQEKAAASDARRRAEQAEAEVDRFDEVIEDHKAQRQARRR